MAGGDTAIQSKSRGRFTITERYGARAVNCTGNICVICLSIPFLPRLLGVIICVLVCSKNENFSSFLVILCKLGRVGW